MGGGCFSAGAPGRLSRVQVSSLLAGASVEAPAVEVIPMLEYAELFKANGSWSVRFTSARARAEVIKLFGTAEIPTPFTAEASYDEVRAALNAIPANSRTCFVEAGR